MSMMHFNMHEKLLQAFSLKLPYQKWTGKQKAHEREFVGFLVIRGRPCGIRTCDQRIKSPLLYQLS
jgi:hypothetical protein